MPIFQYDTYRNPYGPSIAEALAHQADPQAAAALRSGDIEARAAQQQGALRAQQFSTLGAIPGEIQAERDAQQTRQLKVQEQQLRAQQIGLQGQQITSGLEDKQRQRDAEAAFARALAEEPLNPDNTYNIPGLAKRMDPKYGAAAIPLFQHIETVNNAITGQNAKNRQEDDRAAEGIIAAGAKDGVSPLLTDNWLVTAAARHRITPEKLAQDRAALAADPTQAEGILRSYLGPPKTVFEDPTKVGYDPITNKVVVQGTPKTDFEKVTDVTGPQGEPLSYDKSTGTYHLVSDPRVIVKVPTITKKPPTAEEDKARYLQLGTDAALGKPLSPADQAWKTAYEKEKTLTVDTSASAASNRQATAISAATAQQQRAQDFTQLQAARSDIRENVDKPYATAKSGAETLRDVVTAAQGGNKLAASMQNLQATMADIKSQGLNRINTAEIGATGNAGTLWDHIQSYVGQKAEGQPVPPNIQKDMLAFADILDKAAYKKYSEAHDATNTLYSTKIPRTYAPPTTKAAPAAVPAPVAAALQAVGPGRHTLSDGSVWEKHPDGSIVQAQ